MNEEKTVPFSVYESEMDSHERTKKRLIAVILVLLILFAGTNGFWIYEWTRFDTVSYSYQQDGKGTNIIGSENEVNNGSASGHPSENAKN